jgi:tetrahydromethanopterin S-methyltransferase subunit H
VVVEIVATTSRETTQLAIVDRVGLDAINLAANHAEILSLEPPELSVDEVLETSNRASAVAATTAVHTTTRTEAVTAVNGMIETSVRISVTDAMIRQFVENRVHPPPHRAVVTVLAMKTGTPAVSTA